MVERIVAGGGRLDSGLKCPIEGNQKRGKTHKQRLEQESNDPPELSFPAVFDLLQEDGVTTAREQLGNFASIILE